MLTHDIAGYLQTIGIGTVAVNILEGFMPNDPTLCIALYQGGGNPPEVVRTNPALEYPELHVRVRGATYNEAFDKANDIMIALHTLNEQTLNSVRYLYVKALMSPTLVEYDYSSQPPHAIVAIDFLVTKECES